MIIVNPYTQVEEIKSPAMGILSVYIKPYLQMYNSFFGYSMPKKYIRNKPAWYTIDLPKRFKDVPYESRQEVRRLLYTLKQMDKRTEFENIILYKFR